MLGPLDIDLSKFGVSSKNGFLPDVNPLPRLEAFSEWEDLVDCIPKLLEEGSFRQHADALAILDTSNLHEEDEWRRAYHLLSFMTHSYIWGGKQPSEVLPPQITKPFLVVASHLGLAPTATYAALNLWNFASTSPTLDLADLDHLSCIHTFTNTPSESWFYLISVSIEARGAEVIPLMITAVNAIRANEPSILVSCLEKFSGCIKDCGTLLQRMSERCDPEFFYNNIRPFLAGSKNMSSAGLPRGVFYDEGEGKGEWRQYNGGSNAQSSLMQFWDAVLGVKHVPTRLTGNTPEVISPKKGGNDFLDEMRNYMPGPHRAFLEKISEISPIHTYVNSSDCPSEVTNAYNHAVEALAEIRDIHIQLVTQYIIKPSRKATTAGAEKEIPGLNLAAATTKKGGENARGTGGTRLMPFLEQSRDETREMAVDLLGST